MFAPISLLHGNLKRSHGKQKAPRTSDMDFLRVQRRRTNVDKRLAQEIWESTLDIFLENDDLVRQQRGSFEKKT